MRSLLEEKHTILLIRTRHIRHGVVPEASMYLCPDVNQAEKVAQPQGSCSEHNNLSRFSYKRARRSSMLVCEKEHERGRLGWCWEQKAARILTPSGESFAKLHEGSVCIMILRPPQCEMPIRNTPISGRRLLMIWLSSSGRVQINETTTKTNIIH